MRKIFADLLEEATPRMNDAMVNGMSMTRVPRMMEYVDSIFRSASKSFPPGLEYIGCKPCTPYEEYQEATKPHNNRRTYDIARSDLFMCRFYLAYKGEELKPKYISLPFLRDGGILWLGGSPYHISPVLSDQVISVGFDSVFVRLLRDKLTFKRVHHTFICDGKSEAVQIVWSRIYRNSSKSKVPITTRAESTVLHYLLCRYGFTETMRRLIGTGLIIGEDLTEAEYPSDEWVICRSVGIPPKTYIGSVYTPSKINVAIPRSHWNNVTKSVMASFFYLVDHFPEHLTISSLENKDWWIILLGHVVHSGNFSQAKLFNSMKEHFASIEDYVDGIISRKLHTAGYVVHDLYDLFELVVLNFNKWVVDNQNQLTSIYGRTLEIDYYIMFDISSGIFRFMFNLNKVAARKELTKKDVEELLNTYIKPGAIYKLRSGNLAVSSVSYSGDNKYPKISAIIAEQESRPGPKRGEHRRKIPDQTKRFHSSMLELGSFLYLPKSNPVAVARLNPYTTVNPDHAVIEPRMDQALLKKIQSLIDIQVKTLPQEVLDTLPR